MHRRLYKISQFIFMIAAVAVLIIFLGIANSSARTITVDDDGGSEHTTIQGAVDAAQDGDTIQVMGGTYTESVLVDKVLTISGNDPSTTIIDAAGLGTAFLLHADGITLSGFTIQNGHPTGVEIKASEVLIENCVISWCDDGIRFSSDSDTGPLAYVVNTTYGGSSEDVFRSVAPTEDGGYILLASTKSYGGSDKDYWLIKVDRNGVVEWDRVIDTTSADEGFHVLPTTDGGYLISGYTDRNSNDFYIVKTNATGVVEWDKDYGGGSYDSPYGGSVELEDGSFVLAGYTTPVGKNHADAYILKIDGDGNEVWGKNYGEAPADVLFDIALLPDKGFLTTGYTMSWGEGEKDVYILRTDENGDRLWQSYFGGPGEDRGLGILVEEDRYLLVGFHETESKAFDAWLMVLDENGNLSEGRLFGGYGNDRFDTIVKAEDGGYLLSGNSYSYGNGGADSWLMKIDSNLNEEWNVTFGGSGYETGFVMPPNENTLTIFSRTESYGSGGYDAWMLSYREILDSITIRDCTISSNNDNGIYCPLATNLMIRDCDIRNNGESGAILRNLKGAYVLNNSFSDNMHYGLKLSNVDLSTITLNTALRNKLSGFLLDAGSWLNTITYNNLSKNEIGLSVSGSSEDNEIHQNHIEDNVIYGLNAENNNDIVVDATLNWWGSADGPHHGALNPDTDGDTVSNDVLIHPWLTRPTEYFSPVIDQHGIVPDIQLLGGEVKFTARGTVFGAISGYAWRSNLDGEFYNGSQCDCNHSSLSQGNHTIFVKVRDYFGEWSPEAEAPLVIHTRPTVEINESIKKEITERDTIRFSCTAEDDGEIVRYVWSSSEDGMLYDGPEPGFTNSNLSKGDHNITVRVLDNYGVWSETDLIVIHVEEKKLFIDEEIGPFPIIYYMVAASLITLLCIVILIALKKKQLTKQQTPAQQQLQWPSIQAPQQPMIQQSSLTPGPPQAPPPGSYLPPSGSLPGQSPSPGAQSSPTITPQPAQPGQFPPPQPQQQTPMLVSQPYPMPPQPQQPSHQGYPQQPSPPTQPTASSNQQFIIHCPSCGKAANAAWTNCLKCGAKLK